MGGLLGGIADWVVRIVQTAGYPGIVALLLLENLFPPIPSELILPLAGFLAVQGQFALPGVWAAATGGSLLGALMLYTLGRVLGEARLRELVKRWGKWLLVDERDLDRGRQWFDRHGGKAVLICRLVPVVRSVISIPAGLEGMPLGRFVLYTLVGSGVWNAALIGAGWLLGNQWQRVQQYAEVQGNAALLIVAGWIAWGL